MCVGIKGSPRNHATYPPRLTPRRSVFKRKAEEDANTDRQTVCCRYARSAWSAARATRELRTIRLPADMTIALEASSHDQCGQASNAIDLGLFRAGHKLKRKTEEDEGQTPNLS